MKWYVKFASESIGVRPIIPPTFNPLPTQAPQAIKIQSDGGVALDGLINPTEMQIDQCKITNTYSICRWCAPPLNSHSPFQKCHPEEKVAFQPAMGHCQALC